MSFETADISNRESDSKKYWPTMKDVGLTFSITYRNGNANFDAIRTAALAKTPVQFYILDGPDTTTGSQGLKAYFAITGFDGSQPLADGVTYDLEFKPTFFEEGGAVIDPEWHVST